MRESVVYQRILREGEEQERERTKQLILRMVLRPLQQHIGEISNAQQARIKALSFEQLESLSGAFLDFESEADLMHWLEQVN